MKDDMISKQAAIKSVCTMLKNCFNATDECPEWAKDVLEGKDGDNHDG